MTTPVIVLYEDIDADRFGHFTVTTEEAHKPGWVILARLVDCPNKCHGGELWAGDLVTCHTCDGASKVEIGIGGAYVEMSHREPIPEEPSEFYYFTRLYKFTAAVAP